MKVTRAVRLRQKTSSLAGENPRLGVMTYYHVWFSPKNRKAILEGELGVIAKQALAQVAAANGIGVLECESSYDHVHLLLEVADGQSLPSIMHRLKGASAHAVFVKTPDLKHDLGHAAFWQRGYGSRELTRGEIPKVSAYIRNHREDHEP